MSTSGAAPAGGPPSGAAGGDLAGVYPAPSVAKIQGRGVSANAPGDTQAMVWNAGLGLWVPTTLAIPVASATVTGPDAFGTAAAAGAAATFSRGDHDHGLPANPSAPFAAPAIVLGTAAAAGVSASKIRADATIVAFDATAPVAQAFGDAAAAGAAAVTAHRDHRHGMPATPVTSLNGGTGVIAQANGYGITGANANPPTPAVALTDAEGALGSDVALVTTGNTTVLTTAPLAIGTWLVNFNVTGLAAANGSDDYQVQAGTATVAFTGPRSGASGNNTQSLVYNVSITVKAVVTVAGTLVLVARSSVGAGTAKATTVAQAFANATGWTAVRIA